MKSLFEASVIKKEDMLGFVNRLMEVVKALRRFMLNPDGLLLYPEFIFYGENTWYFCYLPGRKKSLCEAFHVITEYFVRKLDYEDTEGIMLAYELHKATLQENYDLEKIMDEYRKKKGAGQNLKMRIPKRTGSSCPRKTCFLLRKKNMNRLPMWRQSGRWEGIGAHGRKLQTV